MVHALILAGGRGERFWPLSRTDRAKQFLRLAGDETLLARTAARLAGVVDLSRTVVITGRDQAPLVRESLPGLPDSGILGEPFGRNTAPAVAIGALWAARHDPEALLVVVPSDAWVGDDEAYRAALSVALARAAASDALGTIGIVPTRPETGYGYLELGEPLDADSGAHRVARFVEKPDPATALQYLAGGRHLWNCGIFVMRVAVFRGELRRHLPDLAAALDRLEAHGTLDDAALDAYYAAAPSISIDYGIMERADRVFTVRGAFPWDDLGSWSALERVMPATDGVVRSGEVLALDSPGSIVYSEEGIVAILGLPDTIVVRTKDATLVLPKERAQEVRRIVQALKSRPDGDRFA